jgi:excisionase family DNA binding protein
MTLITSSEGQLEKPTTSVSDQLDAPPTAVEGMLSVDECARRCNVSDKTIRRWIKGGHLACVLVGPAKRIRIKPSELARMLKNA